MCALVTGVQTCALPISRLVNVIERPPLSDKTSNKVAESTPRASPNEKASQATSRYPIAMVLLTILTTLDVPTSPVRSEERRVGKECDSTCRYRGWGEHEEKKCDTEKAESVEIKA